MALPYRRDQDRKISHWLETGQYEVEHDIQNPATQGQESLAMNAFTDATAPQNPNSFVSQAQDTEQPVLQEIMALLQPSSSKTSKMYDWGLRTWARIILQAGKIPALEVPINLVPTIMLKDVPPLPPVIRSQSILVGSSVWSLPRLLETDPEVVDDRENPDYCPTTFVAQTKFFRLSYDTILSYTTTIDPATCYYGKALENDLYGRSGYHSIVIVTMAWSYILSAELSESQGLKMRYNEPWLKPVQTIATGGIVFRNPVHLVNRVSVRLARWICALLSPAPGWEVEVGEGERQYTPWQTCCSSGPSPSITSDVEYIFEDDEPAPDSKEAKDLLIELCTIYGLESDFHVREDSKPLTPAMAGFYAALAIPFYRMMKMNPVFAAAELIYDPLATTNENTFNTMKQCFTDLRYYMTLSLSPQVVGSHLWSVFWHDAVACNVVGPWLAGTKSSLSDLLYTRDLEMLSRVFAVRRPRVGIWWIGVCALGSPRVVDLIHNYLTGLDEGYGYSSLSIPNPVVAQWTGAPQSYLDLGKKKPYDFSDENLMVSREDVFRCRSALMKRASYQLQGWRPLGEMRRADVDVDCWPYLETTQEVSYAHWVWRIDLSDPLDTVSSKGFRVETGRYIADVPDHFNDRDLPPRTSVSPVIPQGIEKLSKLSTRNAIIYGCMHPCGETSLQHCGFDERLKQHPWVKDLFENASSRLRASPQFTPPTTTTTVRPVGPGRRVPVTLTASELNDLDIEISYD